MRLIMTKKAIKAVNAIYNLRRLLNLCCDFLYEFAEFLVTVWLGCDFFLDEDFQDAEGFFRFVLSGVIGKIKLVF